MLPSNFQEIPGVWTKTRKQIVIIALNFETIEMISEFTIAFLFGVSGHGPVFV